MELPIQIVLCLLIGAIIGTLVLLIVISALFKSRITTYLKIKEIESDEIKCVGNKLDYMKKIIDYGSPINYGSVIISILVAIIVLTLGLDNEPMKEYVTIISLIIGILVGAPLGDGLAHFSIHNIFLNTIVKKNNLNDAFSEVDKITIPKLIVRGLRNT